MLAVARASPARASRTRRPPGRLPVRELGLDRTTDGRLWDLARDGGYILVTKDGDFDDAERFPGPPPTVIRVRIGNGPTALIEAALLSATPAIQGFSTDDRRLLVVTSPGPT